MILSFWENIVERFSHFGEAPLCNLNPDTTFTIFGFTFFLCYRCTFIIIGLLVGSLFFHYYKNKLHRSKNQLLTSVLLILPTTIDGILQYGFSIASTNPRRILTGLLAGIGFALFVEWVFRPKERLD